MKGAKGVAVIIQARLGSTRLPGKALLSLNSMPILQYVMKMVRYIDAEHYILACDEASYKTFLPIAEEEGYTVIEGDENDVLSRFALVIKKMRERKVEVNLIVRVTADNPFIFVGAANASINRYFELDEPDYFTFTGLPYGSGVELIKASSLLLANENSTDAYDREHVGPALYRHKDEFRCVREATSSSWYYPEMRCTVDEEKDYKRAVNMAKYLFSKGFSMPFTAEDIIKSYEYATKLILFYPSIKVGEGTGHLRRVIDIALQLRDVRYAIYVKNKNAIKDVAINLLQNLPSQVIVDEFPKDTSLVVLDNFRSSNIEVKNLKKIAPVVAIDEGGEGRGEVDFLIDILPSLRIEETKENLQYKANIEDATFIKLPNKRRAEQEKKKGKIIPKHSKVLVCLGGEDANKKAIPTANALSVIGFQVSVIHPNLSFDDITHVENNIKTYQTIENLRERLYEWDIVVTHYGFTAFEALAAGCLVLLTSPTEYHYKLSLMAGFSATENDEPTIEELKKIFSKGLKVPKIIDAQSEGKSLSAFIKTLFYAKKCNCPVCAQDMSENIVVRTPDKTVAYCSECHIHYLSFIVSKQSSYKKSYFFDEYKEQYGKTYLEDFDYIKKLGEERIKNINAIFDEVFQKKVALNMFTTEKKLLDIGCAYGPFLVAAKESLWQAIGTDICQDAVEYVTNTLHIPAFVSSFPSMPLSFDYIYKKQVTGQGYEKVNMPMENDSFVAITMWYVIEHFPDLDSVLEKISSLLMSGGIFAFSTPTISGITGKQSIYNFACKSPIDHYSLWDATEVEKLLEKYNFKVLKIVSVGHHPERFNLPFKIRKGGIMWKIIEKFSRRHSLGDGMEVYAIKRGTI